MMWFDKEAESSATPGTSIESTGLGPISAHPVKLDTPILPGESSDSTGNVVFSALSRNGLRIEENDVVVVTSKIVSILEGRCCETSKVEPSLRARVLGKVFGRDPGLVELILHEGRVVSVLPVKSIFRDLRLLERAKLYSYDPDMSHTLIDSYKNVFMVKRDGIVMDDAGIDAPNLPAGWVALLPEDACRSARSIREQIQQTTGRNVAVIITDTTSVKGRLGSQDIAIGFSGIDPIKREHGRPDLFSNPKSGGMDITVDSISGFAGSVMGAFDECSPICVVRGLQYSRPSEDFDMDALSFPSRTTFRASARMILPNILLSLLLLLTLPFKKSRSFQSK